MWRWKKRSNEESVHKQANLIFYSMLIALVLGTASDVVLINIAPDISIQMAPIWILLPIAAIYYSIRKYSFLGTKESNEEEKILDSKTRARLNYYVAIIFYLGSMLAFLARYFPNTIKNPIIMKNTLTISVVLFVMGSTVLLLQLLKWQNIGDFLIISVVLLSIPVIILSFIQNSSITVWSIPLVLMIVSLVFNSRVPLILITIMSIITQVIVWIYGPIGSANVSEFDYLIRIGILLIAFRIGLVVNKIYVNKLKENSFQINLQKIVSDLSFEFISINQNNLDDKIELLLELSGRFFNIDRSYVIFIDKDDNKMEYGYQWCNESIYSESNYLENVSLNQMPWLLNLLELKDIIIIEDVNKMPSIAVNEKEYLLKQNTQSVIAVPVEEKDKVIGLLGFDSVGSPREWTEQHISLLKILANVLSNGLSKVNTEKKIEYMAYFDHLTGLPNRILFEDRLEQAIQLAKRNAKFLGVMFMDLDGFKVVNDTMGHSGGDKLLKAVARGLVSVLRKTDTVARFGGDEFMILINNIDEQKYVEVVAGNIKKLFEKPFLIDGQEYFITGSSGVAIYPIDGEDAETLNKNADIAMFRAKTRGKNQYALCTEDMKEEVKKNMILSNYLYRAQERNELVLHYQPQIKLSTGEIQGFEALIRWEHPELGTISPGVFIPLAEKNGLINSIGQWVLQTASSQSKKIHEMGFTNMRMAVNLSVSQFNNPSLVENVNRTIESVGIDPEYLELEITESIATKEANYTIDILNKLKALGVLISIDDFGTEYSSLSRLRMLPVDRIKIDMQFVKGIETNEKDRAITKVIINLAQNLGLEVIAEGVETFGQSEYLLKNDCDEVQGFLYFRPMSGQDIENLLMEKLRSKET
ncbi:MAG: EAL domain-containing protein [Tissierellaceae bacterium]|nr:EAL domain-containing protein [Tissierellaceae bacterium]